MTILRRRRQRLNLQDLTPSSQFHGPGTGLQLIAGYDALVLPTCYDTKGRPGVLIEAMRAGIPAISIQIRNIPELISHGENGILVDAGGSRALARAMRRLPLDSDLRQQTGQANYRKGREFGADVVVRQMLEIIFSKVRFGSGFVAGTDDAVPSPCKRTF